MSNVFFYEPAYNFDRFFEHAFQPLINTAGASSKLERTNPAAPRPIKPRMDLHEDSEKNLVSAIFELPGINKDSVHLEIRDGHLTVSAETKSSMEYEKNGYAVRERQYGKLARTLRLPKGVKDEDIKAAMEDGLLTITFPKSSPEQEPRKILIA